MKIILVASVQHTRAWFTIEFLKQHPEVTNFVEMQVLRKNHTYLRDPVSGQPGLGAWHALQSPPSAARGALIA